VAGVAVGALAAARLRPAPELPAPQWQIEPHEMRAAGDQLESAVARGQAAKRLLEDEVLQWALGQMRQLLNNAWELSDVRDPDRLQLLRLKLDLLKEFYIQLELLIAGGELAADRIRDLEREREHRDRYGRDPVV